MFKPTHLLVSRSRQTPVQLTPSPSGYFLVTAQEWQGGKQPAFELHSKLGFFCQGISIVGYRLQPIPVAHDVLKPKAMTAAA
jgi:hypothetical protein